MKTILTEVEGSGIQVQGKATFSYFNKGTNTARHDAVS